MAFYDSCPRCSKCCCCINLRTGAIILGIASLFLRAFFFYSSKNNWLKIAFHREELFLESVILIDIAISTVLGTIADVLLIIGAYQIRKYVCLYLPMMFFVFVFEILLYILMFVMGYHWATMLDSLILGVFHVWCWFTAHSLNQNWNKFESSRNKPEDFESVPTSTEP